VLVADLASNAPELLVTAMEFGAVVDQLLEGTAAIWPVESRPQR
jgi:hypothetical protein